MGKGLHAARIITEILFFVKMRQIKMWGWGGVEVCRGEGRGNYNQHIIC